MKGNFYENPLGTACLHGLGYERLLTDFHQGCDPGAGGGGMLWYTEATAESSGAQSGKGILHRMCSIVVYITKKYGYKIM